MYREIEKQPNFITTVFHDQNRSHLLWKMLSTSTIAEFDGTEFAGPFDEFNIRVLFTIIFLVVFFLGFFGILSFF